MFKAAVEFSMGNFSARSQEANNKQVEETIMKSKDNRKYTQLHKSIPVL